MNQKKIQILIVEDDLTFNFSSGRNCSGNRIWR